jgi:hypothetical protein
MRNTLVLLFMAPAFLQAQNVGIGTTTPAEKLEVKNNLRSTVRISSGNLLDTTQILLSNRNSGNQGTDFSIKSIREEGLFFSSLSDLPVYNSPNSLVISPYGFTGINDAVPSARLSIAGNETVANGLGAALKIQNTASANAWYLRAGGPGTFTPNGGLSIADNTDYHFTMDNTGNLGLGILPSSGTKLHVNGGMKIQGTNILEMGAGVAGKEVNAGKIGYNGFGQNALTFIGAGTNAANRAVYFYAEGGTTMNGPLNIGGTLSVNGSPGAAGQVLTSNGTADPEWKNTSFTNTTRFAVRLNKNAALSGNSAINLTFYNQDPGNITIGASSITVNRSGLYHFDIGAYGSLSFASATTGPPSMGVWLFFGLPSSLQLIDNKQMQGIAANTFYSLNEKVAVEVYITAPATISVYHTFSTLGLGGGASTHSFNGFLTGHLISE